MLFTSLVTQAKFLYTFITTSDLLFTAPFKYLKFTSIKLLLTTTEALVKME